MKCPAALFLLISMSAILSSLATIIPRVAQAAQNVLILTDNSGAAQNGDTHVSDLIAAFTNAGATVTTNSTELTNGTTMPLSLVSGRDVVIVVTVTGAQIDAGDIPVLQSAVNTRASSAFLFFTDACSGCTRGSASAVLPIVNAAGGWTATLGSPDNSSYVGTLTGAYSAPFAALPTITSTAYSPLLGVPPANVIYTTNAPASPGACAVFAPGTSTTSCVYMATDVTEFSVTGGISPTQANGLAAAYLNAATGCGPHAPPYFLFVTSVRGGSVAKSPDQPSYGAGAVVQLTATPAAGGSFSGWSGDASGAANPLNVTMDADKYIGATFSPFFLTVTTVGSGSVAKSPDQPSYGAGAVVQLTATPAAGGSFSGWSGDASGSANPLNVTMNSDKNITARFRDLSAVPSVGTFGLILLSLTLLVTGGWKVRRRRAARSA